MVGRAIEPRNMYIYGLRISIECLFIQKLTAWIRRKASILIFAMASKQDTTGV